MKHTEYPNQIKDRYLSASEAFTHWQPSKLRKSSDLDVLIQLHDFLDSGQRQLLHTEVLLKNNRSVFRFGKKKRNAHKKAHMRVTSERTTVRFLISSMTRGQKDCRVCWASLPLAPKVSVDIL